MQKGNIKSPAAVIIFSIITCGIYTLIWIYNTAKEIKLFSEKQDINPGLELLLCILCFPYMIYWSYKYGQLINEAEKKVKIEKQDNSILYLILAILGFFIVDMAIMQSSLNEIWKK